MCFLETYYSYRVAKVHFRANMSLMCTQKSTEVYDECWPIYGWLEMKQIYINRKFISTLICYKVMCIGSREVLDEVFLHNLV